MVSRGTWVAESPGGGFLGVWIPWVSGFLWEGDSWVSGFLARETLKDPYNFEFLALASDAEERALQKGLLEHIQQFLVELGAGFAFVGQQYPLEVGGIWPSRSAYRAISRSLSNPFHHLYVVTCQVRKTLRQNSRKTTLTKIDRADH